MTSVCTTPLYLCRDAGTAYSIRTSRGPLDLSACLSLSSRFPPLGFLPWDVLSGRTASVALCSHPLLPFPAGVQGGW